MQSITVGVSDLPAALRLFHDVMGLKVESRGPVSASRAALWQLPAGTRVLGFNYDTGERYLSVPDFLPE